MDKKQIEQWGQDSIDYLYNKDYLDGRTERAGKTHLAHPGSLQSLCGRYGQYQRENVPAADFQIWIWEECQVCAQTLRRLFHIPADYVGGTEAFGYAGYGMLASAKCPFCEMSTSTCTVSPICSNCDIEFYVTRDGRVWFDPARKSDISWAWKMAKSISHVQIGEKSFQAQNQGGCDDN